MKALGARGGVPAPRAEKHDGMMGDGPDGDRHRATAAARARFASPGTVNRAATPRGCLVSPAASTWLLAPEADASSADDASLRARPVGRGRRAHR